MERKEHLAEESLRRSACYLVLLGMILPNLIWILLDRGLWASDTAQYGLVTLELHEALAADPGGWIGTVLAVGPKPPILAWLGQLFVPVGELVGSIDAGLLLFPFLSQAMALVLLFEALVEHTRSHRIALTASASVASAPLFLSVSKELYIQPLQLAAVCWFLYVMASSKRWDALVTLLQLSAATSFSMLATMSSPAFCVVPGAIALVRALTKLGRDGIRPGARHVPHLALAGILALPAVAWYAKNALGAIDYGRFSFDYGFGGWLGAVYLEKLWTWTSFFHYFGLVTVLVPLLLVWIAVQRGSLRASLDPPILAGLLQIVMALAILASSEHQTLRYSLPLLGLMAWILGAGLTILDNRRLTAILFGAFLLQLGLADLVAFGWVASHSWLPVLLVLVLVFAVRLADLENRRLASIVLVSLLLQLGASIYVALGTPDSDWWVLKPVAREPGREVELVDAILAATSGDEGRVVLVTGALGIFSFHVEYHAAKSALSLRGLEFASAEFVLTRPDVAGDIESAWREIAATAPARVVLVSAARRAAERERWTGTRDGWLLLLLRAIELSENFADDGSYRLLPLTGYPEIEVYERVDPE